MQPRLFIDVKTPANESREHFRLKHFARRWLFEGRAVAVALEVSFPLWDRRYGGPWNRMDDAEIRQISASRPADCYLRQTYGQVDCVGVARRYVAEGNKRPHYPLTPIEREIVSVGIEVKVSRSDFLSGYHTPCSFNYVLVPKDLVLADELPDDVGLLYAGDRRYKWGMYMIRRARERKGGALLAPLATLNIAKVLSNQWEYRLADDIEKDEGISAR